MYSINRKSTLFWKLNPSTFEKINTKVINVPFQYLGSHTKPVNTMLSLAEEQRMIMPVVLASDPSSVTSNWDNILSRYWHGLSIPIPPSGLELEIGFNFYIDDPKRERYIKPFIDKFKINTDKELAEFVMGNKNGEPNVPETEKYKYGSPIDPEKYMWWRYALINREVANTVVHIDKSNSIRFYLHSDEDQKRILKERLDISKKAIEIYNNIISSDKATDKINNIVTYLMQDQLNTVIKMDDDDRQIKIIEFVKDKPQEFISSALDKGLKSKVEILKFIDAGIFRKPMGTSLIVDAADTSIIIGDNIENAVTFLNNPDKKEVVEKYRSTYQSLIK